MKVCRATRRKMAYKWAPSLLLDFYWTQWTKNQVGSWVLLGDHTSTHGTEVLNMLWHGCLLHPVADCTSAQHWEECRFPLTLQLAHKTQRSYLIDTVWPWCSKMSYVVSSLNNAAESPSYAYWRGLMSKLFWLLKVADNLSWHPPLIQPRKEEEIPSSTLNECKHGILTRLLRRLIQPFVVEGDQLQGTTMHLHAHVSFLTASTWYILIIATFKLTTSCCLSYSYMIMLPPDGGQRDFVSLAALIYCLTHLTFSGVNVTLPEENVFILCIHKHVVQHWYT